MCVQEASDLSMTQRVVQDEDERSTFVNIQSESAALLITAAHCLCERWLERALSPHKTLETGSPFLSPCHYESVEIKTQSQAGSQPNSAN